VLKHIKNTTYTHKQHYFQLRGSFHTVLMTQNHSLLDLLKQMPQ